MSTFGSTTGVAAYTAHAANGNGVFDSSTTPTLATVEAWLVARAAQLSAWLALAGYEMVADWSIYPDAKAVLDRYANNGAAGDVELSLRSAGYSDDDQNRRENKFLKEFDKAEAFITSGALDALGVPRVDDEDDTDLSPGFLFGTVGTRRYAPPTEWSDL